MKMRTKTLYVLLIAYVFSFPIGLHAGSVIGPDVSVYNGEKLQWEEGAHDYFVMFKSMLANNDPSNDETSTGEYNPQADECVDSATFELEPSHIPEDAYVERAFLIWTGGIDPLEYNNPADNKVTLSFTSKGVSGLNLTQEITADDARDINSEVQDFVFESVPNSIYGKDTGYFTYRADITSFFNEIHNQGRNLGAADDGYSLQGDYTLSDFDCSEDFAYVNGIMMVSGWTIVAVYRSGKVNAKKIYMYNGFSLYQRKEVDIEVKGFEFPKDPAVRLTMMVTEGDPGLVEPKVGTPPETLAVSGANNSNWVFLANECNPFRETDEMGSGGLFPTGNKYHYTEVFSSISSYYGWNDTIPVCKGGNPDNFDLDTLEYAMDVDTFLMDSQDPLFSEHLIEGDTSLKLKVSANADVVFTNFLIVSLDTRAPKFDIPENDFTPTGDEKYACSCAKNAGEFCATEPIYYMVKIQNWGGDRAYNVRVRDELPPQVNYIPGTTEIAKDFDAAGNPVTWEKLSDASGGGFPLAEYYDVAESMEFCDEATNTCEDTVMVRFQVQPKGNLSKKAVIENTAFITDASGVEYKTHTFVPLKMKIGDCLSSTECEQVDLTECGGEGGGCECVSDDDCSPGSTCSDCACVEDEDKLTKGAVIELGKGDASPSSDNEIIVQKDTKQQVLGQFYLKAKSGGSDGKFYRFDKVSVAFDILDTNIIISNLKLVHDANGNGQVDADETVISDLSQISNASADFVIGKYGLMDSMKKNNFIVVSDISYVEGVQISQANVKFQPSITSVNAIEVSDKSGDLTVEGSSVVFPWYVLEPDTGFIFTYGPKNPKGVTSDKINKTINMMHVKAKPIDEDNTISEIIVNAKGGSAYVRLGEGITNLSLWLDNEGDGVPDSQLSKVDISGTKSSVTFTGLDSALSFKAGEEKYLIIKGTLNLSMDEKAAVTIEKTGVKLTNQAVTVIGPPVTSNDFTFACPEEGCSVEDDGCTCSLVQKNETSFTNNMLLLFSIAAMFMALRKMLIKQDSK